VAYVQVTRGVANRALLAALVTQHGASAVDNERRELSSKFTEQYAGYARTFAFRVWANRRRARCQSQIGDEERAVLLASVSDIGGVEARARANAIERFAKFVEKPD
jgi:hypothetical protein